MPEFEDDVDDSMDDFMIFPITDLENNSDASHDGDDEEERDTFESVRRPSMTLRQRRYSKLGFGNGPLLKLSTELRNQNLEVNHQSQNGNVSLVNAVRFRRISSHADIQKSYPSDVTTCLSPGKRNWLKALHLIRHMNDPWAEHHIEDLNIERAVRHRYNAIRKQWKEDHVLVKMEAAPFNHGAMRSCFRLKKKTCCKTKTWRTATNYVAKKYMENVEREVYFEDVKLQMDAKLWGEEYNRHNPPKKVDIFQMYVLEYIDRPGRPLYHLEHFIEGDYIKYNSNSGFVDENLRLTPQAFSHFTFERSGHELIVVDIQGVGDLWTDPQIHTKDGTSYGDGNLGPKGMALFFHSHSCNSICDSLNLTKFDLAPSELMQQEKYIKTHKGRRSTVCRHRADPVISASPMDRADLANFLWRSRSRTMSTCSEVSDDSSRHSEDEPMSPMPVNSPMEISPIRSNRTVRFLSESDDSASTTLTEDSEPMQVVKNKLTKEEEDEEDDIMTAEEERMQFRQAISRGARPSCVAHEINLRNLANFKRQEDSILGQIHHDLAKYHELGRFTSHDVEPDMEAALFHEQSAADLGIKEAILTLANLYLGLQHDVLANMVLEQSDDNIIQGVDYMIMAAEVGDRSAMIYMAKAFETGLGLGGDRTKSYKEAMSWYEKAVNKTQQDDSGEFDATIYDPLYQLQAKMADMYLEGGFGLEKDPSSAGDLYNEAAENAMAAMKGRLANKYYALAEEAYAQIEEE